MTLGITFHIFLTTSSRRGILTHCVSPRMTGRPVPVGNEAAFRSMGGICTGIEVAFWPWSVEGPLSLGALLAHRRLGLRAPTCRAYAFPCMTAGIGDTPRSECVQQPVALSTQED